LFITVFCFKGYDDHRDLHSFPTRRSSDLSDSSSEEDQGQTSVFEEQQPEQGRPLIPSLNLSQIPTDTNKEVLYDRDRYNEPNTISNVKQPFLYESDNELPVPKKSVSDVVESVRNTAIEKTKNTENFIKDRNDAPDLSILIDLLVERIKNYPDTRYKNDIEKLKTDILEAGINYNINGTLNDLNEDLYNKLVEIINGTDNIKPIGNFEYIMSLIQLNQQSGGSHRSKTHKRKRVHFKTRGKKGGKKHGGKKNSKKRKGKHSKTKSN